MEPVYREVKTSLLFCWSALLDCPPHVHDDIELIYVLRGSGTAFCDGRKYELHEGSCFVVFPNQVHHYADCTHGQYVLLVVKPSRLLAYRDTFLQNIPLSSVTDLSSDADSEIVRLLETILAEWLRDRDRAITYAYLTVFFGKLLKHYTLEKSSGTQGTVTQVLQYCAAHYKEPISVASVAEELHLSRSSVSHIFSRRLSINFCDYINALRLGDAVQHLKSNRYSITEVADMSGFTTIRTFNRAFLKQYGISPTEYRRILQK